MSICNHHFTLRKSLSSVILHAVTRGFPKNRLGTTLKLTVHGINSHETIDTQIVELKLTPIHSNGSCPAFVVKPLVRKDPSIGTELIDVESLQVQHPHLEPLRLKRYS